ncbi:ABC transporter ATP-binding protein [Streptomyces sp. NPDC091377]|uniref:ABC transporter ATP-binding protein n=1 Tax=Streptomyces sp. NPDC091377 TaxID=3365995 RepID=UPI0038174D0B
MIELINVSKVFRVGSNEPIPAVEGVELTVGENEFVALIGRSGSGKSTLLRMIAGLVAPTTGHIRVAGQAVTSPQRSVSFMFQRPALLPWRSVIANIMLPIEVLGLPQRQYRHRAHELIDLVGLKGFSERFPHELSGGMQQRVSLCRSLIQEPSVLLMDEPFSALDALTRSELSKELARVQMELSTTIVFVTHSIEEAVLLADRVVVLSPRPGRIQQIVEVSIQRPRSLGVSKDSAQITQVLTELHELLSAPVGGDPL